MAEINKEAAEHSSIENVSQALSKAEQFIENNKKIISVLAIAIILIAGGIWAYKKLYIAPMEKEAYAQMFVAEQYFEKDSFQLALNGDGNNWGFVKIIDEYSPTKAGNLAQYYAGICYLHLGKFQQAIDALEDFDSDDKLVAPIAKGATADAYVELGKTDKALSLYLKAAKLNKNEFTSPIYLMKAAQIAELLNDYNKALEIYKEIKKEFPRSSEGRQIEKYIARAEILAKK